MASLMFRLLRSRPGCLSHLKKAGASAALEIARQDVLADMREHIPLSTLDMAQCVSDFGTVDTVGMQVCASCGTRDPDDPYSREVIRRLRCTSARLQPSIRCFPYIDSYSIDSTIIEKNSVGLLLFLL